MKNREGLMFGIVTKYVMKYCLTADLAYWLSEKMVDANVDKADWRCIKSDGNVIVIKAKTESNA